MRVEEFGNAFHLFELDHYFDKPSPSNESPMKSNLDFYEQLKTVIDKGIPFREEIINKSSIMSQDAVDAIVSMMKGDIDSFGFNIYRRIFQRSRKDGIILKLDDIQHELAFAINKSMLRKPNWLQELFEESYANAYFDSMMHMTYRRIYELPSFDGIDLYWYDSTPMLAEKRFRFYPQAVNHRKGDRLWRKDYSNVGMMLPYAVFCKMGLDGCDDETKSLIREDIGVEPKEIFAFWHAHAYIDDVFSLYHFLEHLTTD